MSALELKIPPPAVALIVALLMWVVSLVSPSFELPVTVRSATAIIIAVIGTGFGISGIAAFWRARTTVNPLKPQETSALVISGVYRVTRNPMYLGVLLVLIAWGVFLSNALALLCAFAFISYMNRFQIGPEERFLLAKFGTEFTAYKTRVRRWL